jgi:Protein of unknown function (DUF3891)
LRSACSDRAIEYNQKLLAAWDQLSVELCRNPDAKFSVDGVPIALGKTCRLLVTPVDPDSREVRLEPWPFSKPRVELTCEGHVLDRRFTSEADLRKYLKDARRVSVIYTLTPSTRRPKSPLSNLSRDTGRARTLDQERTGIAYFHEL